MIHGHFEQHLGPALFFVNISIRISLLTWALVLPALPVLAAGSPAPSVANPVVPEAKPYVLYMRTDLAIEQNKKLYPVKDVHGSMFIIAVKGEPVSVPMTGEGHKLEFQPKLTLTRNSASLTGLFSGRAYTAGRDPKMKRQREAALNDAVMADNAAVAEQKFMVAENKNFVGVYNSPDGKNPDGTPMPLGQAQTAENIDKLSADQAALALQSQSQMENKLQTDITSGGFARLAADADMAMERFDAVEVRFEVSSPEFLEKPYVVVITRFHARDDKPGVARNAVFAKALEGIGAKPTKVAILHGGYPPGFEIEELQVHLYNEGREIPTEVAQKRVPLSRDEAFEYLKIDYFRDHKAGTVAATPAVGRPDRQEMLRLGPKLFDAAYFVKVDKSGRPGGVYADEDCSQPVDATVAALAGAVRYYPALENGKTVDGVARLVLSRLDL